MRFGRVIGTVVADTTAREIDDFRLLLVRETNVYGADLESEYVVLDTVGANRGDLILFSEGSSCRQTDETMARPVDRMVVGIIDLITIEDRYTYRKHEEVFSS